LHRVIRRLLPLALLPSLPAMAETAGPFCAALRELAVAAADGFESVPRGGHKLPGSVEERRGITRSGDGPPRAVFYAVMLRDGSRQHPNPADARFRALGAEIPRCLPEAEAVSAAERQGGADMSWRTSQAVIGLRLDRGDGYLSNAEVEVSIASRW
jgi:hypothetical protein